MRKKIRVAIAEDHELVRQGIINLLSDEESLTIVSAVSNGAELLNEVRTKTVDIILLDLEMPVMGGKEALKVITSRYPSIRVIILSMHYADDFIIDCIGAGARGFLPKNCDIEKVIDAIYAVHDQGYYFDDKMSKALLFQVMENKDVQPVFSDEPLTAREIEIVKYICEGKTNQNIADDLYLSIRTVEVHRKNISKKTNATNVVGVVIYAIKNGFYKI